MNFLSWNCRGTSAKGFPSLVKDLKKEYDSSLIFLLETHSSGENAGRIAKKMGFQVVFEWMQLGILGEFGACGT